MPDLFTGQLGLVYDTLLQQSASGQLEPLLATSWGYSDNSKILTLNLRQGVDFQDGTPFNSEAVAVNLQRSKTLANSTDASLLTNVTSVAATAPYTVQIHLSQPDSTILNVLTGPAGAMISPTAINNHTNLQQDPVGVGMYKLTSEIPDASATLTRWPGYWDPSVVDLNSITLRVLPDTTAALNAVLTGQIDVTQVAFANMAQVKADKSLNLLSGQTLVYAYLAMNLADAPLNNLKVRQAIAYAIDRNAIVKGPFLGDATPTIEPFPQGTPGYVPGLTQQYAYNVAKGKQLMQEAGYPHGFSMQLIAVPQPELWAEMGQILQQELGEIGIKISIKITPASQLGEAFYIQKSVGMAALYTGGGNDPLDFVAQTFLPKSLYNAGGYAPQSLIDLYNKAVVTTNNTQLNGLLQDITRDIVSNMLAMPIAFEAEPYAVNSHVTGYQIYLSGYPSYRGVGMTG